MSSAAPVHRQAAGRLQARPAERIHDPGLRVEAIRPNLPPFLGDVGGEGLTMSGNRRNEIEVDSGRLWATMERSGEIGRGQAGGLRRLALTEDDRVMRDQFVAWCRAAGCTVTVDGVGNIFARRAGSEDRLPPVVIGSHLDTQVPGGRYDGILGVMAGLEILRTLNDHGIATRRALEVVSWSNEEGARFQPPMTASAAFAGRLPVEFVLQQLDDDGSSYGEALEKIGYAGPAPVGKRPLDSYFELHIEQGPRLEQDGVPLGIVTGGYAVHGMHVDVTGETAHSGPTPMDKRRNALVGAAMIAVAANEIGWRYHPTEGKATVPRLVCWPNKPGILPSYAQVSVDVRHADPATAAAMREELVAAIAACAARANVEAKIAAHWTFGSEAFDAECAELVRNTADMLGVRHCDMMSQAGHDAYNIARVAPTCLLFTPCRDGISHNEAEHIEPAYTLPGVNVLLHAVIARANRR
jgi:N-carbamoyl-L-amino-acid hydrolase